jgi:hypothetical protein
MRGKVHQVQDLCEVGVQLEQPGQFLGYALSEEKLIGGSEQGAQIKARIFQTLAQTGRQPLLEGRSLATFGNTGT